MAIARKTMPSKMPENPTLTTNQMTYPMALPPARNPSMSPMASGTVVRAVTIAANETVSTHQLEQVFSYVA
jgi:hypothetical protein